ncbi:HutD family protein [Paraclostridium bifermentans]|uniref:HutD/Ves family protein n=1 Tax=Paraclostridium bifermentans TaxID=1490 RepID=UPI00290A7D06|nr:HutD family protein [Paraclostridium bifermentans]MDU3336245.1 HutD family protein [Paraclostridium bifermentans]
MTCKIKIVKEQGQKINKWSGGITNQLYIYPENSSYENRNFKWRISSATVEAEESEFTKLPNIQRKIMVLDGGLLLRHQNHYDKKLKKFDIDSFSGDWDTTSYGKATDFNLMTSEDCSGELRYINVKSEIILEPKMNLNDSFYRYEFNCFYSLNGSFKIKLDNGNILEVEQGDLAIVKFKKGFKGKLILINSQEEELDIIESIVYY